ncbi:hypothetical protein [Streptomyces brasiliensis]|uniref:Uncharacterized protein n=1 Tax=Streptomyces brasiliensis TaxID=1954 RepID=A0A917KXL2_9ACTN|nr:hypothetical protein [Streptomyces brasiliensis]GGJ34742.1 hypothetical protein GCM10010121_052490 [Streptomyces brasiliensis]
MPEEEKHEKREAADGIARLEGYLLWSAHLTEAHEQATRFTSRLSWLTTAQREDVENAYVSDHLALSRATDAHIVRRILEIRAEYTERYEHLKVRCIAWTLIAMATTVGSVTPLILAGAR